MPYIDLEYKFRTDEVFRAELVRRATELMHLEKTGRNTATSIIAQRERLREFIKFCNFNLVFLTSYYFPRYPKDKPLRFFNYPFAFQLFEMQIGGYTVIRGSRQISKSTSYSVRQLLQARLYPGFHSLYICPRNDQLSTYANKLREIESASRFFETGNKKLRKNLNLKEFSNKSTIELVYVLQSASNVRGKSADELLFDEFQDFDPDLEIEISQIQSASETPVTFYSGTSLTTDSALEQKYRTSSMCSWLTRCGCGHYNIPLPEYNVLDMIQPKGPCCSKCGRLINIREGRFIPANRALHDRGFRGYHIPQIIVPAVFQNQIRWSEIYRAKVKYGGNRKFLQEILGIATEEGEREITKQNLIDICTLGKNLRVLHDRAMNRQYQFVVSGCDWGGSDYIPAQKMKISTTVHTMCGITGDGSFELIHIRRYSGMNYDDIAGDILFNHQKLRGNAMASDFGVGTHYNALLRQVVPPEKHLIFGYVGPASALISEPDGAHMFNQWSVNKTDSISQLYEGVRYKRLRCFDWELAEEFLSDFLNMYRAPCETPGGATTFRYMASASRPNDTLQSVNYCYLLGRILLGEPMFADMSLQYRLNHSLQGITIDYAGSAPGAYSG